METASSLNERLGLSFSNFSLLTRALTHRSYANEHQDGSEDNERLEYLGDAVLDFIVAEWAYRHFPERPEGDLTKVRSHLVRNEHLAEFARQINLGGALRLGRGERTSGGYLRDSVLGSAFEALLGAIYLDSDFDKVRNFMLPFLEPVQDTILDEVNDPKSQFQEEVQAYKMGPILYRVISTSGPDHARMYEVEVEINGKVMGRGSGSSKANAEREAARDALKKL
ncbi:MAG: ribonuclease III [Anaerolineales bacterium]|nr:ribonuclease III [Anaerolineales bacterium]